MVLVSCFLEILRRPTTADVIFKLMELMWPIWMALFVGVLVGWAWRPKWASMNEENLDSGAYEVSKSKNLSCSSKLELMLQQFQASMSSLRSLQMRLPGCISWISFNALEKENSPLPSVSLPDSSTMKLENEVSSLVTWDDLKQLRDLVEVKDRGSPWIQMMDRSTPNMNYQAWRRDPETGPPQYRSRTIYEDATPEMLRDFFWDDEFRLKWDDMLLHSETLDECPITGTMRVRWVRKFPFFCSHREYIIGRRIWDSGQSYYCVTKGVPCSSRPHRNKPRRVDLYYSSWCIRAAESRIDGRMTACEVLLFHHEDMGIPWELAKLGIRQGMWGAVKKIDPGLRAYQKHRASGEPKSHTAIMAQINTKVSVDSEKFLEENTSSSFLAEPHDSTEDKASTSRIPKILVVGGVIALVCSLDRGLLTKAVIFGVARRFANMGKRL